MSAMEDRKWPFYVAAIGITAAAWNLRTTGLIMESIKTVKDGQEIQKKNVV